MNKLIDLHVHSTASDGIYKPSELVQLAHETGVAAIALADHDSTAGIDEAITAAQLLDVQIIPAVELSVAYNDFLDVHILGYGINHHDTEFCNKLALFRIRRESRGLRIIDHINEKLTSEGKHPIDSSDVLAIADGALGRPHIARILIEQGHATCMQDAFTNYLLPCNVPKEYFALDDALAEIKRIGGVSVLAHPQSITRNRDELYTIISDLAKRGVNGIEAINSMGLDDDSSFLQKLAKDLGLLITGGSDFHGNEEGLAMGRGRGSLYPTTDLLKDITALILSRQDNSPA
jgi:predicted metal-dependent phosphoesterase TrpH